MILFSTIVASLYIFLEFLYFLGNHFCNICIAQSRKYTLSNHHQDGQERLHLDPHHCQKFREINATSAILVHLKAG